MKRNFLILILIAFFISACNLPAGSVTTQTASPGKANSPCGDGVCSGPENAQNCPADCSSTALGTGPSTAGGTSEPAAVHQGDAPLYMTTMTHMEGGFTDDRDQGVFLKHVEENGDGLHYFFSQMQTLAQQGVITWATQKQVVYEAYVAWNQ